ncbi:MAG: hypothetical protein HKM95_11495 [Inquilinus sp.]|nr:hypothetical protein [Inquilinus sp.]
MTRYLWVPHPDSGYDTLCGPLSANADTKVLTRPRGRQPVDKAKLGEADRFAPADVLTVMGHGVAADTGAIGWAAGQTFGGGDAGPGSLTVRKTYRELAHMIVGRLGPKAYRFPLQLELLNCWGGDRTLFAASFGAKLASALGAAGVSGRVVAYTGAVEPGIGGKRRLRAFFDATHARQVHTIPG